MVGRYQSRSFIPRNLGADVGMMVSWQQPGTDGSVLMSGPCTLLLMLA